MNSTENTVFKATSSSMYQFPKVLIVEDEQLVSWSLSQALSKAGFDIITVNNGELAIEKLKTGHFDLVITDFELPKINGFAVASEVKLYSPTVPVILTSAISANDSRMPNHQENIDFFIEKPYDLNEVKDLVFQLLSEKK